MLNDFFDIDSEPIFTLEAFFGPPKKLVEKCLVIFSKVIYEHMLRQYNCRKISEIPICNGDTPIWALKQGGKEIAFYLSPIGSALAGSTVAEVNHLTGASKFVMFGSCGSLDAEKTSDRFIVPTSAYRGEGLSYYFAKAQDYIEIKNAEIVAGILTELKIPFVRGRVWTTDSSLRETVNLVNQRKREGCIAVEMEIAGVQAVCDFYSLELYDFMAAGDVLAEGNYETEKLTDANHNIDKLQIALQIAERV